MKQQKLAKSLSERTICGPFDYQFKRKFLGNRSSSLLTHRQNLLKTPLVTLPSPFVTNSDNLLPKIREIEKIAKSGGKKLVKKSKYGDVISQLELYLAKKLVSNQSTKELITKIEANTLRGGDPAWPKNQNVATLPQYSQTQSKFYNQSTEPKQEHGKKMIQTSYSQSKKWISDKEFRDKFDKFVMKKHEQDAIHLKGIFSAESEQSPDHIRGRIESDKKTLKQIVKKMIDNQNSDSEGEAEQQTIVSNTQKSFFPSQQPRSIRWIIQKCEDFQKSFKNKRRSKSLKKAQLN